MAQLLSLTLTVWSYLLCMTPATALMRGNFAVQPHPIQFNEEPEDWTVSVGSSISLTCNTSVVQIVGYLDEERTPSPQIEWIHNNITISSGGHYTINNSTMGTSILTITNVTLVEQGDYHCLVNDWKKEDGGWWTSTRSRSGHIRALVVSSDSVTVYEHDNIILSCMGPTLSVPSDGVVWMKDGVMIIEQATTSSDLMMVGVNEDDSGQYQCSDPVDNILLSSYQLVIHSTNRYGEKQKSLPGSDHFVKMRSDKLGCLIADSTQSVSLHCNATGYQEMMWYKNGQLLDVNSTDIVFNQTTSSWTITKNNPCDLLGVYQCFVSNEVGTVHVSTRVLPLGWPNHPGRPELLAHSSFSNGFKLVIKLYPPDYLGGIAPDQLMCDVYMADALNYSGDAIQARNVATNATVNIELSSTKVLLYGGIHSALNAYYFYVQLRVKLTFPFDLPLTTIFALPTGSQFLQLRTYCELIDYPPPIVEETCHYNDTGDFVTHNISWRVEGSVLNYVFADHVKFWIVNGDCTFPNGTIASSFNVWQQEKSRSFDLPINSSCIISVIYATRCYDIGRDMILVSFNTSCDYTTISTNDSTDIMVPANPKEKCYEEDHTYVTVILIVSGALLTVFSFTSLLLCFLYIKYIKVKNGTYKLS